MIAKTNRNAEPMRGRLRTILRGAPIIPALRREADLATAAASSAAVVYLMNAELSTLDMFLQVLRAAEKDVIVHLDLCSGLARDVEAVNYLANSGVAGIISTHVDILGAAASRGLYAVQRTFMIDSSSVQSALRSLKRFEPDALELLPAPVAPRIVSALRAQSPHVAAVGGGLVTSLQEADALIQQGLDAVSVGSPSLWSWPRA